MKVFTFILTIIVWVIGKHRVAHAHLHLCTHTHTYTRSHMLSFPEGSDGCLTSQGSHWNGQITGGCQIAVLSYGRRNKMCFLSCNINPCDGTSGKKDKEENAFTREWLWFDWLFDCISEHASPRVTSSTLAYSTFRPSAGHLINPCYQCFKASFLQGRPRFCFRLLLSPLTPIQWTMLRPLTMGGVQKRIIRHVIYIHVWELKRHCLVQATILKLCLACYYCTLRLYIVLIWKVHVYCI